MQWSGGLQQVINENRIAAAAPHAAIQPFVRLTLFLYYAAIWFF